MSTLIVGSHRVKKGIEYHGLIPLGNAFQLTENVPISINRTPFCNVPIHIDIFALSQFSYSFERDTTLLLTRVVQDDLSIIWNSVCAGSFSLVQNVESDTICEVTTKENVEVGEVQCATNIENLSNFDANIIVRFYDDGALIATSPAQVVGKDLMATVLYKHTITTPIEALSEITFTVESDQIDTRIIGGSEPSQIQVVRIS